MRRLVLFDIDGTLIDPGGAGRKSLTKTFREMFLIRDAFADIRMAGKTDIQIIKEGLKAHGLPTNQELLRSILSSYLENLKSEIQNDCKRLLPGVTKLLDTLQRRQVYLLGLLTGNIQAGARIKLEAFDLNHYFPTGAFGDDHEERDRLLPIAVKRFEQLIKEDLCLSDCVVVGDTPRDVKSTKPYGAVALAVSTGPYSYEALLGVGADYVLEDLCKAADLDCFGP